MSQFDCSTSILTVIISEHGDSLKSLQRQLSEFDRKRHDHNEILTRIDVSQILTQLQQQKQSNAVTRVRSFVYFLVLTLLQIGNRRHLWRDGEQNKGLVQLDDDDGGLERQ